MLSPVHRDVRIATPRFPGRAAAPGARSAPSAADDLAAMIATESAPGGGPADEGCIRHALDRVRIRSVDA